MRGNYTEDGYSDSLPYGFVAPNDYGLLIWQAMFRSGHQRRMEATAHTFTLDMNPHYEYKSKATILKYCAEKLFMVHGKILVRFCNVVTGFRVSNQTAHPSVFVV